MRSLIYPPSKWLSWPSQLSRQILIILLVAMAYYFTGSIGLLLAIPGTNVTTVWPPSGIALAAGLLYGYRIWPGVFLGSFINNIVGFLIGPSTISYNAILWISLGIAAGSVLQMWAGLAGLNFLLKGEDILGSAKNVFKFLLVGVLSCMVNSTIGTLCHAIGGAIPWSAFPKIYWNWWLGDTAGVFVFTPLIWAWLKYPLPVISFKRGLEGIILLTCLFATYILLVHSKYPFIYILVPLLVWAGLRFSHQGATLLVVLTSVIAIWGTEHGTSFFKADSVLSSLIFLQSFVGITTIMTLALGAVVQERLQAYAQLKDTNQNLELKVEERTQEIQKNLEQLRTMQQQIIVQQKLASLGQLTAGIAHEIRNPLNFINNFADLTAKQANILVDFFDKNKGRFNAEELAKTNKTLDTIVSNVSKINQYGHRAESIVKTMLSHARSDSKAEFLLTDLASNIMENIKLAYHAKRVEDPTFNVTFEYEFDPSISKLNLIPQEFSRVILNMINNAFYAVHKKKEQLGDSFTPKITVTTKSLDDDHASIIIRDNGTGIPQQVLEKVFTPFYTTKPPGEGTGLGLSLSRDVIVSMHHGEIKINTREGEFTEFIITLPK